MARRDSQRTVIRLVCTEGTGTVLRTTNSKPNTTDRPGLRTYDKQPRRYAIFRQAR